MRRILQFLTNILAEIKQHAASPQKHLVTFAAAALFFLLWMGLNHEVPYIGEGYDQYGACLLAAVLFAVWLVMEPRPAVAPSANEQEISHYERIFIKLLTACLAVPGGRLLFTVLPPWDNGIGAVVGMVIGAVFMEKRLSAAHGRFIFRRGAQVLDAAASTQQINNLNNDDQPLLEWAGFRIPGKLAEGNFLCCGAMGTGKTRMHRELMASVLPHIGPGTDQRAVIYDVKTDALAELQTMKPSCEILVMNPYDRRSLKWDIAGDITDTADARNFAEAFIPDSKGDEKPFFVDAARAIVAGVIDALNERLPGSWTLRDLLRVTATKKRLEKLLAGTDLIPQYFSPDDTFDNIRNQIANVTVKLEPVAGAWEHTSRKISIKRWAQSGESVLVLAGKVGDVALQLINRVMCKIITTVLLDGPESPTRSRFWFFCDELKDAGRLDSLPDLLNGRSKGVRCVLGLQDFESLLDAYRTKDNVKAIAARCRSITWLKLGSADTAEWASKRCGEVEQFEYFEVETKDGTTINEHLTKREAVIPSEFMSLPEYDAGNVHGVHILMRVNGVFKSAAKYRFPDVDRANDFHPREAAEKKLAPWTAEDDKRLCLDTDQSEPGDTPPDPPRSATDLSDLGRVKFG